MTKTLRPEKLSPGIHVIEAHDRDERLLVRDFWVENQADIERLIDLGVHRVTVDEKTSDRPPPTRQKAPSPDEVDNQLDDAHHVLKETQTLYRHTVTKIKDIFFSADRVEDVNPDELMPFVEKVLEYADDSPGSIAVLTQVEDYDFDTFRHSVNMGILSILYAQHCDYDDKEMKQLAFGAMLHDIGKIRIPEGIILKEGDLSDEEYEIVKTHTTKGYEMLMELGIDEPVARMALEHHERPDESGYPEGTSQLHPFARVVSVFDVYDAMTSKRVYSEEVKPNKAFPVLRTEFGDHPETRSVLYDLLRCLGLYPVGSLVELTDGEIAFVQRNHPGDLKNPVVCVVVDEDGADLDQPFLLDLSRVKNHKTMKNGKFYDYRTEIVDVMSIDELPLLEEQDLYDTLGEIGF